MATQENRIYAKITFDDRRINELMEAEQRIHEKAREFEDAMHAFREAAMSLASSGMTVNLSSDEED